MRQLSRLALRRLLASATHPRQPPQRNFIANPNLHYAHLQTASNARPQLPFLFVPTSSSPHQQFRYLTTERKAMLKEQVVHTARGLLYFSALAVLGLTAWYLLEHEKTERKHPTPHEWWWWTRVRLLDTKWHRYERPEGVDPDWVIVVQGAEDVIKRLEDENIDGAGLKDAGSRKGEKPEGAKDVTAKSEAWRRGYYEALMLYAEAAVHVDGWVIDRTRKLACPPDVVRGPSNPRPSPLPAGAASAPREEDCEPGFAPADGIYMRILGTEGFTARQKMDAALGLANYFEYKGLDGPAVIMLEDAIALAQEGRPKNSPAMLDSKSWAFREQAGSPSENLLRALTAYATFKARHDDVSTALPILISILRARKALPNPEPDTARPAARQRYGDGSFGGFIKVVRDTLQPVPYPPPPPDGSSPPVRDAKEICEEAALHLHIGEIIYASRASGREDGLAWTRDAVDMAEQQLRSLEPGGRDKATGATCRACLSSGFENWSRMVERMAKEERERAAEPGAAQGPSSLSWLVLWGEGKKEQPGRWAAEELVVQERMKRARDLLENLSPPPKGIFGWFMA